jgi:YVTN family beta-propeller protein
MRTLAFLLASATLAVAAATATANSARPHSTACATGSVRALIGGHATCLHTGAPCKAQFQTEYRKHGYSCVDTRLRKTKQSPKPPAFPPTTPANPNTPPRTKLQLPAPTGLPEGTTTLTLPAADAWQPSISDLTASNDSVWVSSGLFRVDPGHNSVSGPFTHQASADIVAGEGSIWASDYSGDVVRRFDPSTGNQVAVVKLAAGSAPEGLVDANGSIWVANHHGGSVSRIDPATNKVVATVRLQYPESGGPQGIAAGLGSVWVTLGNIRQVARIDPATNRLQAFVPSPLEMEPCGGIAVGQTAVWATSCLDDTAIERIDPAKNRVVSFLDTGGEVIGAAADGDTVWFVSGGDPDNSPKAHGYLIHLRADDTVAARIDLGPGFISGGVLIAFGSIWLSDFTHPRIIRIPYPN